MLTSNLRSATGPLFPSIVDNGGSTLAGIATGTYNPFVLFPKFVFLTINPDRSTFIRDVTADRIIDGQLA